MKKNKTRHYTPNTAFENLEKQIRETVELMNGQLEMIIGRMMALEKVLNLTEAVQLEVNAKEREVRLAKVEETKEALKVAVEMGKLVPMNAINDDSLIVGRELDKDGGVVFPGHVQAMLVSFNETAQNLLVGKEVGTKVELPGGGHFEILAAYSPPSSIQILN